MATAKPEQSLNNEINVMSEFENKITMLGINGGCMAYKNSKIHVYYANENVQWLWIQFLKMKGLNHA